MHVSRSSWDLSMAFRFDQSDAWFVRYIEFGIIGGASAASILLWAGENGSRLTNSNFWEKIIIY